MKPGPIARASVVGDRTLGRVVDFPQLWRSHIWNGVSKPSLNRRVKLFQVPSRTKTLGLVQERGLVRSHAGQANHIFNAKNITAKPNNNT